MEAVKQVNPNKVIIAKYSGTLWGGGNRGGDFSLISAMGSPVGIVNIVVAKQTDLKMVNDEDSDPMLVLHHNGLPLMHVNIIGKLYVDQKAIKEFAIDTRLVSGNEHDIEDRISYIYEIMLDEILGCLTVEVNLPDWMVRELSVPGQWMHKNRSARGLSLIKMNFVDRYNTGTMNIN
jgi:hypothetical protein